MRKQSFHCNQKQRSSIAYFAQYRNTLPQDISNRLSIPFSLVSQTFQIRFLGSTYWVTHPDFRIQYLSGGNGVQSLCSSSDAQHLLLHYFIDGDHQETVGAFLPVQALPWDGTSAATFQRRCTDRLAHSYGNRPDIFQAVMESLLGIRQAYGDISYDTDIEVSPKFFGWVCGLGKAVRILAPAEVVEEMGNYVKGIAEMY